MVLEDHGDIRESGPAYRVEYPGDDFSQVGAGKDSWISPESETVSVLQWVAEQCQLSP
jgi:hypothetical protein